MDHAHAWHLLTFYPWERGLVSKHVCPDCGRMLKVRYEWLQPRPWSSRRPRSDRDDDTLPGRLSGFLLGVGFATFVFAVAVMRGCASLPPAQ